MTLKTPEQDCVSAKEKIHAAIKCVPYLSSSDIAKRLGLKRSTISASLQRLRVERRIHVCGWRDGSRTPLYRHGEAPDVPPPTASFVQDDVLALLDQSPGLSKHEISARLGNKPSALGPHLARLLSDGVIRISDWRDNNLKNPIPLYGLGSAPGAPRPSQVPARERILALLEKSSDLSPTEIQKETGVMESTLRNSGYLRALRNEGLIHIGAWRYDPSNRNPIPLYRLGGLADAPQPAASSPAKARVLTLLEQTPGLSQQEIAERAFVSEVTLSYGGYIKELRHAGLIYVSGWRKCQGSYRTPLYSCGNLPDSPRPRIDEETRDSPGMRKILDVLTQYGEKEGMSYQKIADLAGLSRSTVKNSGFMKALITQGLVHIAGWRCTRGPLAPLYLAGAGKNAPKPNAATARERGVKSRLVRRALQQSQRVMSLAGQLAFAAECRSDQSSIKGSTLPLAVSSSI